MSPSVRSFRRWCDALGFRAWARLPSKPSRVFYANGGIGDELMLTAVAAAARAAGRPISIVARYPAIWESNRDPASLHTNVDRWHYCRQRDWISTEIVHVSCRLGTEHHLAEQMAAHAGVSLAPGWRPVYRAVSPNQREPELVVLQNSCRGALYAATTKEWPSDRWEQLARRLASDFHLVQIGTPYDPALPLVEDLRGRTSIKQAAALLARAAAFVGLESGLQHLAAAMGTPSVILFGGRSSPAHTGYSFNRNLVRAPVCAGCGLNTGCPHEVMCMDIPVAEVEIAVRETVAKGNRS